MRACLKIRLFAGAGVARLRFHLRYAIYDVRTCSQYDGDASIVYRKSKMMSLLTSAPTIVLKGIPDGH
jgi:hypothetical protein